MEPNELGLTAYGKLRKVLRYTRLYGPRRTLEKIRARKHMAGPVPGNQSEWLNADCTHGTATTRRIALIGCGNFAFSTTAYYLSHECPEFLRAAMDPNIDRARSLCSRYRGLRATTDIDSILDDPLIQLVYIQSNHASHAEYAIRCIERGKSVHIEKPHATTWDQLEQLVCAMKAHPDVPVFLGFNRPRSSHFRRILRGLDRHVGPTAVNWFVAGHEIPNDHWYFAPEEGGRVLGNLCHWLDMSIHLVGADEFFPCILRPGSNPESRNDFALVIECANGSCVTITFSAKGHIMEGVSEVLNVHRGEFLGMLRDFEETLIREGAGRRRHRSLFRDHGHRANIINSMEKPHGAGESETSRYVYASGALALAARDALESGKETALGIDF